MPTESPTTDTAAAAIAAASRDRIPSQGSIVVQFVLTGIIWGSSFLFMKVALERPLPRAGRMVAPGAGRTDPRPVRRAPARPAPRSLKLWGHMTVLAISFCVVPFLLFSWAQQHVTSGLASIYNATTPIMTAVMAGLLFRVERLKLVQIAGILVGILGVMVIIAPWQGLDLNQSLVAQFAILGATACYGFSLAYMRKFVSNSGMSALVFSFLNIGIAAAIMIVLTPFVALVPGGARSLDRRQRRAARLPRHRCRLHLEPEHAARVGAHPRIHRDLHHSGRRAWRSAS